MLTPIKIETRYIILLILSVSILPACLTAKKMDAFVAEQFNNELPKPEKKKNSEITITSSIPSDPAKISTTERKTSKVLPLILYWQFDYRHTCVLNPAIGVNNFRKTIYQQANKLNQKLSGQQLELNVEQIPGAFAIVDKAHFLLVVMHWDRLYVEPDFKDLVVSYKAIHNGSEIKSGKIAIKSIQNNRGIRYAQSWKSTTSEFIGQYNLDIAEMTKKFVTKLIEEL